MSSSEDKEIGMNVSLSSSASAQSLEKSSSISQRSTDQILEERSRTHGDFRNHAFISQSLKDLILLELNDDVRKSFVVVEGIEMICHKLARIAAGDPLFKDHWDDIAGYATLVSRYLATRSL